MRTRLLFCLWSYISIIIWLVDLLVEWVFVSGGTWWWPWGSPASSSAPSSSPTQPRTRQKNRRASDLIFKRLALCYDDRLSVIMTLPRRLSGLTVLTSFSVLSSKLSISLWDIYLSQFLCLRNSICMSAYFYSCPFPRTLLLNPSLTSSHHPRNARAATSAAWSRVAISHLLL